MSKKINCIMLIDDNKDDNFYHERIIKRNNAAETVLVMESGKDAINYLKANTERTNTHPNLIFLDINMPGMNGWEFIEEYEKLDKELQSNVIVLMLTTSDNPEDKALAKTKNIVCAFKTKPLTKEILEEILITHDLE